MLYGFCFGASDDCAEVFGSLQRYVFTTLSELLDSGILYCFWRADFRFAT